MDEDEDETMALAVVGGDIGLVWFGLNQILMWENEYISEEDINSVMKKFIKDRELGYYI